METLGKRLLVALLLASFSFALFAQEKTQSYYLTHESEILPDAQASFKQGNYDRAVELCVWHYIIVGTQASESLRDNAEKCAALARELAGHREAGRDKEAEESAKALLALNPDDPAANDFIASLRVQEEIPEPEVVVSEPPTLEIPETVPVQEEEEVPVQEVPVEVAPVPEVPQTIGVAQPSRPVPSVATPVSNRFIIKANVAVLDLKQFAQSIAPGVSLGLYDIGGSPVGAEVGAYVCSGLPDASVFGMDASLAFRVANGVYPKAGVGFFSCSPKDSSSKGTNGLCAGLGLAFLAGHFCLEAGLKYYPEVKIKGTQALSTDGVRYDFPSAVSALSGGIAPMVGIGWSF
jgi:hypothetical protein